MKYSTAVVSTSLFPQVKAGNDGNALKTIGTASVTGKSDLLDGCVITGMKLGTTEVPKVYGGFAITSGTAKVAANIASCTVKLSSNPSVVAGTHQAVDPTRVYAGKWGTHF